ncbi:hypothetical protein HPB51_018156 [Rhipicephalus microplus]|uniref:DM2 domain-containing protein n=1 Tax=Rhipicephalus microplus TaxID=6941 RepID=A0A9J6D5P9_RHIMP|nr:hypothetical protein HPB51_018156 [Rhipicephalus microplus]
MPSSTTAPPLTKRQWHASDLGHSQPLQFKLDPRLARLLGIHTQTRPVIIAALWQYVKTHRLQDPHEREHINCDKYLEQIFQCQRMKFAEIPQRLHQLLHPPDPIVINHVISLGLESLHLASNRKIPCAWAMDIDPNDKDAAPRCAPRHRSGGSNQLPTSAPSKVISATSSSGIYSGPAWA